jgi:small conductance mechanosensitive channel
MNDELQSIGQIKATLLDLAIRFGPKLLAALLIMALGVLVSRWTGQWVSRGIRRIELEPPVRTLLARIAKLLVLLLFAIMALQNLGVELLPLIAGLGVAGAGIALAMQGVLSNVAAGLSIIFTKPFRVGEYISIAGEEGRVDTITLFSTTLSHPDRSLVVIPNRKIAGEILHNFGKIRQVEVEVGIAYDADVDAALAVIDGLLKANPRVLQDPPPIVQAVRLADWCIKLTARPWVSVPDYVPATGEITKTIAAAFRSHGIAIPVPQREVRLLGNEQ